MKTILITGSTDGIGKLAALKLAKEGHHIYLHGRSKDKLKTVIQEIKTQYNNDKIDGFIADLSSFNEVKKLAENINKLDHLDVLINNAGVFKSIDDLSDEKINMRLTVNYLAPVILTEHLIDLLEKGTNPRVINLSSAAQTSVDLLAFTEQKILNVSEAYAQSKLALTMWTFYMAKKYKDIRFIAVNPGSLLNTNMVKEAYGHHWSPVDKGADILFELALSEAYKYSSGIYYDNDKEYVSRAHADNYDESKIEALISVTNKVLARV